MIYLGLPQWSHPKWPQLGINTLEEYAQLFNCVEGNTTFYALPEIETVKRWYSMTGDNFRFCFKFPAAISHQQCLTDYEDINTDFFRRLSPLESRIGQYWLQLPARFSPQDLPKLWAFLDGLPREFSYGVEVRHPDFFAKGDAERSLNQGLQTRGVNRVILDSRAVHSCQNGTPALREAQLKKPKLPVHAITTANHPLIRFIASDDIPQSINLFDVWLDKLVVWTESSTPFLFLHTPDMGQVNSLLHALWPKLTARFQRLPATPPFVYQSTLF